MLRPSRSLILAALFVLTGLAPCTPPFDGAPHEDPHQPDPRVDVRAYTFHLTLTDASDRIEGRTEIDVVFRADGVEAFVLDLVGAGGAAGATGMTVTEVTMDGAAVAFAHESDRLRIALPSPSAAGAAHAFAVTYAGVPADGLIIAQNKHGDRTFFGDNWPDRARHWLPVVDHPADKAVCSFAVTAPAHYQVVGCGARMEESDLGGGLRRTITQGRVPMPTKVMVVGVARFAVETVAEVDGVPVETWVYPQDRDAGFYDYALAVRILRFFEGHIGDYPYEKLANVQSKTRYGGMENAGNIFYHENSVDGKRSSESLLAHEIAHQWFGDSVSEGDWHHIWLSEGFATYFTQIYLEFTYGRDRLEAGMGLARERVVSFAQRAPDSPIIDTTITDLNQLLSANSYQKGGWVLHMLRQEIGDDAFWDGIQTYYRTFRDGNALTPDLRRIMERSSGQDLAGFFDQWVYRPGQPHLEGDWTYEPEARQLVVRLRQTQPGAPFTFALDLGITSPDGRMAEVQTVRMTDAEATFTLPLNAPPTAVRLDPNTNLLHTADFGPR